MCQAVQEYIDIRRDKCTDWDGWVAQCGAVRQGVADLIGAKTQEVAITTSASAGINSIASALAFENTRNKVVISDFEFPTNAQIWYGQALRGAQIVRVPEANGYIPLEMFDEIIDAGCGGDLSGCGAFYEVAHRHLLRPKNPIILSDELLIQPRPTTDIDGQIQ